MQLALKRLLDRLYRGLMLVLCIMPVFALVARALLGTLLSGCVLLCGQTLVALLTALLPPYIGSYREYDLITYEGGSGGDPNPDKEARHELIKEGRRFPIRAAIDFVLLVLEACVLLFVLPGSFFAGESLLYRLGFTVLMLVLELGGMYTIASRYCFWQEIPGIALGALCYLATAIYLKCSNADNAQLNTLTAVCSLMFLFLGGIALNRQSIAASMTAHDGTNGRVPKLILRRNRRIVIGFAAFVALVSFVGALRTGVLKALNFAAGLLKSFFALFGSNDEESAQAGLENLASAMGGGAEEAVESVYEKSALDDIIVYAFFVLVGLALLWLLYDGLKKLAKKLSDLFEKLASGLSEGFYDEKEQLMSAGEVRDQIKNSMRDRLKSLLKRETPWEKLNGRERARRLVKLLYKKRGSNVNGLRTLTAREALREIYTGDADKAALAEMYERARYSEYEVKSEQADTLKKQTRL